jgi:hypothetical protein
MNRAVQLLIVVAPFAIGCSSDKPPDERPPTPSTTQAAVDPPSGADAHIRTARRTARDAAARSRAAEETAARSTEQARDALRREESHVQTVNRRIADLKQELKREDLYREEVSGRLGALERHRAELLESGATESDLRRSVDVDIALARTRQQTSETMMETLSQGIALSSGELEQAERSQEVARARLEAATKEKELARALRDQADRLSRSADAEDLAVRTMGDLRNQP